MHFELELTKPLQTVVFLQRLVVAGGVFFLWIWAQGQRLEINTGYSCYLTAACRRRGVFFLLVNLGPGAAVSGMRIEINTGPSSISDPVTLAGEDSYSESVNDLTWWAILVGSMVRA